jgi:hypothetical protein
MAAWCADRRVLRASPDFPLAWCRWRDADFDIDANIWVNPVSGKMEPKVSFVQKVGTDVCGVGAYEAP